MRTLNTGKEVAFMKSLNKILFVTGLLFALSSCTAIPKNISSASKGFSDGFSGTVLVVDKGSDVYYKIFGSIDQKNKRYRIGSVSKTFISSSIAILVDRRQLQYNQTIEEFFPDLNNANRITIKNLVEHRSGLSDFDGKEYFDLLSKSVSKSELLDIVINHKNNSEPNEKYCYSNLNYILLGNIIEKISKQDINSFIKEEILIPLNMLNTGYHENDDSVPNLIPGECINNADEYKNFKMNYSSLIYSGGMYSTEEDLRKWCIEFSNPVVIPEWYAKDPLGWNNEVKFNRKVQYHFGNVPAYSALVLIVKSVPRSYYIVLSNQGNSKMNPAIKKLPEFIFNKKS